MFKLANLSKRLARCIAIGMLGLGLISCSAAMSQLPFHNCTGLSRASRMLIPNDYFDLIYIDDDFGIVHISATESPMNSWFYNLIGDSLADIDSTVQASPDRVRWSERNEILAYNQIGDGLFLTTALSTQNSQPKKVAQEGDNLAWSTDGRYLAFQGFRTESSMEKSHIYDASNGKFLTLPREIGNSQSYAWSSDSNKLAFVKEVNGLARIGIYNADTNEAEILMTDSNDCQFDPHWSPNGDIVVFRNVSDSHADIVSYDFKLDSQVFLTETPEIDEFAPTFSPNGHQIAFVEIWGEADQMRQEISVLDIATGTRIRLTDTDSLNESAPVWSRDGSSVAFYVSDRWRTVEYIELIDVNTFESQIIGAIRSP